MNEKAVRPKGEGLPSSFRLILASRSPRRRAILQQIGFHPEVTGSGLKEHVTEGHPEKTVRELSRQKAESAVDMLSGEEGNNPVIILGADTVVSVDGEVLGKPRSHEEAESMICLLSGRTHQVYTGVTLLALPPGRKDQKKAEERILQDTFSEKTDVTLFPMSEKEIHAYAFSEEPMDKAGAYGIQGLFARYISGISGDYTNVVGLPAGAVYQHLKKILEHM